MADHKLNIFQVLKEIDKKNVNFLSSLSTEDQKLFVPVVVTRWLTGTQHKQQVFLINELVNPYVFALYKHPKLLFNLMTVCSSGKTQRYQYAKNNNSHSNKPTTIKTLQQYFGYSFKEAKRYVGILPPNELIEMAEELGWQQQDLNKLRTELGFPLTKEQKSKSKSTVRSATEFEF